MQLEVIINEGAWAMEMYTQGKIGNKGGASGNFPPIATVTGIMGYYSALKSFKGEIAIVFNTSPLLCAGGTIKFDFDGFEPYVVCERGYAARSDVCEIIV